MSCGDNENFISSNEFRSVTNLVFDNYDSDDSSSVTDNVSTATYSSNSDELCSLESLNQTEFTNYSINSDISSSDSEDEVVEEPINILDYIIIGAGVSGLTLLQQLQNFDSKLSIKILEATDRIGGRVYTNPHVLKKKSYVNGEEIEENIHLNVGAAWMHGTIDNPLMRYVDKDSDLIHVCDTNPWLYANEVAFDVMVNGQVINDKFRNTIFYNKWTSMLECIQQGQCDHRGSIYDVVKSSIAQTEDANDRTMLKAFLQFFETWSGASVSNLPVSAAVAYNSFKDANDVPVTAVGTDFLLHGDYPGSHELLANTETIVSNILDTIKSPESHIELSQPVVNVSYKNKYVTIVTKNNRRYHCRKLITTVPIKPLLNIDFQPPLPSLKRFAMSRISYSTYKKVQLQFSKPFWSADVPFLLLSNPGNKHNIALGESILFNNYYNLKKVYVLEAVVTGSSGHALYKVPDDIVIEIILGIIKSHYHEQVTDLLYHYVSRWEEGEYSQGSYSYHNVNTTDEDVEIMNKNIQNKIYFAGEHTDPTLYGSLNAAYNSAFRVFKELTEK